MVLILSFPHFRLDFFKHFVYLVVRVIIGLIVKWWLACTFNEILTRHQNGLGGVIPRKFEVDYIILDYVLLGNLSSVQILADLWLFSWFLLLFVLLWFRCLDGAFGGSSVGPLDWGYARGDGKTRPTAAHIDDGVLLVDHLHIVEWLSRSLIRWPILFPAFHLARELSHWAS